MTTDQAFLRAIIAAPADDAPRLRYADWLDEHGEPDYAAFVRCQVALARLGPPRRAFECDIGVCAGLGSRTFSTLIDVPNTEPAIARGERIDLSLTGPQDEIDRIRNGKAKRQYHGLLVVRADVARGRELAECAVELRQDGESRPWAGEALRRRERELWQPVGLSVAAELAPAVGRRVTVAVNEIGGLAFWEGNTVVGQAVVRRGFIEVIHSTCAAWCGSDCPRCEGQGSLIGDPECSSCHGAGRVGHLEGNYGDPATDYIDGTMDCPDCDRIDCPACRGTGRTLGIGGPLLAAQPVVAVRVTDREPRQVVSGKWLWDLSNLQHSSPDDSPYTIPIALWAELPGHDGILRRAVVGYDSRDLALAALSTACLALGRAALRLAAG